MSIYQKTITKVRDRLFAKVMTTLNLLNDRAGGIETRLDTIEKNLRQIDQYNSNTNNVQTIYISPTEVLTKVFTDLKIYLNPSDMSVAAHIALDGIWEKETTQAWMSVIKPEYTIFDIGANFGYFGLLAGQFTDKKRANVVLFEANQKLIPYINKSISINWLNEQMRVENLAVTDKKGTATLNVLKNYIGSSSLQTLEHLDSYMHEKMQLEIAEKMKVNSTTIDEYCLQKGITEINLIKMDIEGYEEKAYAGMRKIVKRSKDITLFLEFTKDGYEDPESFYNLMLSDFKNVYIINPEGNLVKPKNSSYRSVIGDTDDWVMPVFSKNANINQQNK